MYRKVIKRLFDIIISFFAILVFSPLFLIIIVLEMIFMGFPIFFSQERIGKNEKTFKLYKFRSMTNKKDKDGNLLDEKRRLTKFGVFLRSSSLDELPELFAILAGHMSIIGPRPLPTYYGPFFLERERVRHKIRGGLIALDALSGEIYPSWERQLADEVFYANNVSFCLDVKVFFATFGILFKRIKGNYGNDDRPHLSAYRKDIIESIPQKSVFNIFKHAAVTVDESEKTSKASELEEKKNAEIGSFLELQFYKGREYHCGKEVVRLNSGRSGIFYAMRVLGLNEVWLPNYECDTVRDFLKSKDIKIFYYDIDKNFEPIGVDQKSDQAIVLVNYYGMFSNSRMKKLAKKYKNVILDNAQAFFAKPLTNTVSVYSARKFVGVPDGAYVVGYNVQGFKNDYERDFSSDTSLFLLERVEYGCEGKAYENRKQNEKRIDKSDICLMSELTEKILDGADYGKIIRAHRKNFNYAHKLFKKINKINPKKHFSCCSVPFVYPLVIEDEGLIKELQNNKIFQGRWWDYVVKETEKDSFSNYLSRYIVPITIDERYGKKDLERTAKIIYNYLGDKK